MSIKSKMVVNLGSDANLACPAYGVQAMLYYCRKVGGLCEMYEVVDV
jgi:hypothetical protein